MSIWSYVRTRGFVFLHDLFMIPVAWMLAFWLRFNLSGIPAESMHFALRMLPVVMGMQMLAYWGFGLYRGVWRFASMPDLMRIIKATVTGIALSLVTLFLMTRLQGLPRSVFPLYGILLLCALGGSRFAFRWLKDYHNLMSSGRRVLIVGAGSAGESLVRDLRRHDQAYVPAAFVDDALRRIGHEIQGVRVMGDLSTIPTVVKEQHIDLIMIALPQATAAQMRQIVALCEDTGTPVSTLPSLNQLVSGQVTVSALRPISLEDLLGRDPVSLQWDEIKSELSQQCVLVSGGGGSIGSELCRQIARFSPKALIVIDHSEFNLFNLTQEFVQKFPDLQLYHYLVDVRDQTSLDFVFSRHKPDRVFHAAAYKHVPMLEPQCREAIRNNVLGTWYIANAAVQYGVQKFVLVSTDKAVNPSNIMGATKRAAEMLCQVFDRQSTCQFMTVRFGNVLGSTGSVVPIFQKQLAAGGPLTVTHPDVTRYFMTIPEASQLILQAATLGKGGEIFVLDMGEPIKISYLAEQMIRLAGKLPGEDIDILYTGLRPGEKLFEELFYDSEEFLATAHNKIHLLKSDLIDKDLLNTIIEGMMHACVHYDETTLLNLLKQLVPELSRAPQTEPAEATL